MALKLKYKDEHGVVQINMSPSSSPKEPDKDLTDPKFDSINNRFAQYDLFGAKYDVESGGEAPRSLFRSRYNSIEQELANTPYAFTTDRSLRLSSANKLDITIRDNSPSKDIQDDRFFNRKLSLELDDSLFGPQIDFQVKDVDAAPAFTVTQLIHAQDRYFDLSGRQESPRSGKVEVHVPSPRERRDDAFRVLADLTSQETVPAKPAVSTSKRKKETSFAILAETPVSRPSSPRSLPVDIRTRRISPFRGRGFREETSRHNTPKTSAANSRSNSPPRRRTNSLSRIDKMASTATLPLPIIHTLPRPHSPRNFLKENIEEVRELSELNREKHEAEAEAKRIEEEEAILKEMGLLDKSKSGSKSLVTSRTNSRSNSPSKINLRSRDNSPSAILHYENIPANSKEFVNPDDGIRQPVTHTSRMRSMSKSQPQSNNGSPKHSKIPKRQSSVSPNRSTSRRDGSMSRRPVENNLNKNQRFISNSTSSIHETIRIGSQVHDKRSSKSTQHLDISPAHIKGKPPISPGRGGPPPSNKAINAKRLSPIVGTPNKSPTDDLKPGSARTTSKPTAVPRKNVKTAGNTPATSRLTSRQPSRSVSRDPSPEKRKTKPVTKPVSKPPSKPVTRAASTKTTQKPTVNSKPETKKPMSRTNSMKSLTRTPSTKNLNEKPPLKKTNSKKDLSEKAQSTSKINEVGARKDSVKETKRAPTGKKESKLKDKTTNTKSTDSLNDADNITKQDSETQYDKKTNENSELVILTRKNIVSMTTAAITSQPLNVVATVTNQLPAAFEKAREKGIFERLSSKESLVGKEEATTNEKEKEKEKETTSKPHKKPEHKEAAEEKEKAEEKRPPRHPKSSHEKPIFTEEQIKLRLLQPPYNNPQVERAKQKIEAILKEPEVSTENILTASAKSRELKNTVKEAADKAKTDVKDAKDQVDSKMTEVKDQTVKQTEKLTDEIRSEVTKIVDSIITPVEEPKEVAEKAKDVPKKAAEVKKDIIEPIVTVVNEKKKNGGTEISEKVNETLVKGEGEVEVQSSNVSSPGVQKMAVEKKMADGNGSDKSTHSNGGLPQSTSTTPKPPVRTKKEAKEKTPASEERETSPPQEPNQESSEDKTKPPNFCQRLINKCKNKCCTCCTKGEESEEDGDGDKGDVKDDGDKKKSVMSKLNCCKKVDEEKAEQEIRDMEAAAGKASIEYENETKQKRKWRDVFCGCCGRRRKVGDTASLPSNVAESMSPAVEETGCCGRKKRVIERRDSILSDRPPTSCCNNRLCTWMRGMCRRRSEPASSRRTSMFSKNKSMSPTLPPEDTRKKLDTSLVEHTSVMRGAIPVLPIVLAYFCLLCNIVVPGLGSILSGMFCLCFGIPRFGVHDGARHRIGSFVINLLVGAGQLFTVLFCLVGWGWSIWWGVIMVKTSRKYRKLKKEEAAAEAEAAPPVTSNNHTRA